MKKNAISEAEPILVQLNHIYNAQGKKVSYFIFHECLYLQLYEMSDGSGFTWVVWADPGRA